ncbi:MAG: AP2/ERF family transcription factor [Cypionkella sp.]|nr:AP2/ERF family transcription factor [Cypionkella sp.]
MQKTLLMHRVIANTPDDMVTDHKDGNGLNNRRANLRDATLSQNAQNSLLAMVYNVSGYKGVSFRKEINKWQAYINMNGNRKYLGTFTSQVDAAKAYDCAAIALHGAFANINFSEAVR